MAKVKGLINFSGTIGGITFYQMNGKTYARKKSSLTANTMKNDPRFEKTRAAAMDFGYRNSLSKIIRMALHPITETVSNKSYHLRLSTKIGEVLKSDKVNPIGSKSLIDADLNLFNNFRFNKNAKVDTSGFYANIDTRNTTAMVKANFTPKGIFRKGCNCKYFRIKHGLLILDIIAPDKNNLHINEYKNLPLNGEEIPFISTINYVKIFEQKLLLNVILIEAIDDVGASNNMYDKQIHIC